MKRFLALLMLCSLGHAHTTIDLKVDHLANPNGVDNALPRLSWRMEGDINGLAQSACQVVFATSPELLESGKPDLWDSGKIASTTTSVVYAGKPLPSSAWIHWKVRTWSGEAASEWSVPQRFLTGLMGSQPKQRYISFRDTSPFHKERQKLHLPPARYYRGTLKTEKNSSARLPMFRPLASTISMSTAPGSAMPISHPDGRIIGSALTTIPTT